MAIQGTYMYNYQKLASLLLLDAVASLMMGVSINDNYIGYCAKTA